MACGKECSVSFELAKKFAEWKKHALYLFLGVPESLLKDILTKEKFENLMVLDDGICTLTFFQLFAFKDQKILDDTQGVIGDSRVQVFLEKMKSIFLQGKAAMFQLFGFEDPTISDLSEKMKSIFFKGQTAMKNIIHKPDYLSNNPLEIAYRWVLPILLTLDNTTSCLDNFVITFEDTSVGRIFDGDKPIQINDALIEKKVKPNTFYYVEEDKGNTTHPLFDFFFLCKDKETKKQTLILIDVTDGDIMSAEAKLERISNWIGEQKLDKSQRFCACTWC